MKKELNFSLRNHNTFSIDATVAEIYFPEEISEIQELAQSLPDILVMGAASNMLFVNKTIRKPIVCPIVKGIKRVFENEDFVVIAAGAGEDWQALVDYTLEENLGGIENLSLIPGKVGAAPVQNIGAYGVELEDVFYALEAIEIGTGKLHTFHKDMCKFSYRNSVFKGELKDKYIIVRVFLKLDKNHEIKTEYGGLQMHVNKKGLEAPSIQQMSEIVSDVRRSKLPYPDQLPNAGSFFKNPIIERKEYLKLKEVHPFIPHYEVEGGQLVKVPAAWLIEQSGLKGLRVNNVGIYENHALILVNYGNGTGEELANLAQKVMKEVKSKFGIILQPEVRLVY